MSYIVLKRFQLLVVVVGNSIISPWAWTLIHFQRSNNEYPLRIRNKYIHNRTGYDIRWTWTMNENMHSKYSSNPFANRPVSSFWSRLREVAIDKGNGHITSICRFCAHAKFMWLSHCTLHIKIKSDCCTRTTNNLSLIAIQLNHFNHLFKQRQMPERSFFL